MGWRVALFAAALAAAGIPLYIHVPLFAATHLGLDIATVGLLLLGLRAIDFIQDPLLGRLIDRFPAQRWALAALGCCGMGAGFALLFAAPVFWGPPGHPVLWLSVCLILIFTCFSLLTILFYAQGVALAPLLGGHFALAGRRETGMLAGVCIATLAPTAFGAWDEGRAYGAFGLTLAALSLLAAVAAAPLWRFGAQRATPTARRRLSPQARRLLGLALVNALPVAVTSTLFLMFVEMHLDLPALAGVFLLIFFVSAGLAAPFWSRLAARIGARRTLMIGMSLSIAVFLWTALLAPGDAVGFGVICVLSGAAVAADFVILPALFARVTPSEGAGGGFGLWGFVNKMALALAAGALVLLGDAVEPWRLVFAYALLPCLLKLAALALVIRSPDYEVAS